MYFIDADCDFDGTVSTSVFGNLSDSLKSVFKEEIHSICLGIIANYEDYNINYFDLDFSWDGHSDGGGILNIDTNYYWNMEYTTLEMVGCPKMSWDATTCQEWKEGWDVTIGGLLPNMTTAKMFDVIIEWNDDGDCEDLELGDDL